MSDSNGKRLSTEELVKKHIEAAKAKKLSRSQTLDELWSRLDGAKCVASGKDEFGEKRSFSTEGYPEDTSVLGVADHFRENASKAGRGKAVGSGKIKGSAKAEGEAQADAVAISVAVLLS